MEITTKQLNDVSKKYIIDCIDSTNYDMETNTDMEKLTFLYETFHAEAGWNIERVGERNAFKNWLQGLPSSFNIVFTNYDIIQLAKKWKSLSTNATEREENRIINNYWNSITTKTFQLFHTYKIN